MDVHLSNLLCNYPSLSFSSVLSSPFFALLLPVRMVLAITGEGTGPSRAVVLCVIVAGILYGFFQVLSVGRRDRRLPPGSSCA